MQAPLVLICHDNFQQASLLAELFRAADWDVEIAISARDLQAHLLFTTPDLMILNLGFPAPAAPVLLRHIRKQSRLARTPVIAAAYDQAEETSLRQERVHVLRKPFQHQQVLSLAGSLV